jgi:hypothetical protein
MYVPTLTTKQFVKIEKQVLLYGLYCICVGWQVYMGKLTWKLLNFACRFGPLKTAESFLVVIWKVTDKLLRIWQWSMILWTILDIFIKILKQETTFIWAQLQQWSETHVYRMPNFMDF